MDAVRASMSSKDFEKFIKENQHICRRPRASYNIRKIDDNKIVKVTCCCNLDTSKVTNQLDFKFIDNLADRLANKELASECHLCWTDEQKGLQSERIRHLLAFDIESEKNFDAEYEEIVSSNFEVGAKLGNKCNLACRSCGSFDSTFFKKLHNIPDDTYNQNMDLDANTIDLIKQKILEKIKTHKYTFFHPIGGEALLYDELYNIIDWAIENNLNEQIGLRFTTSFASRITHEFLTKISKFKTVELSVSIDSVYANYELVRYPVKFDKIEKNLELLFSPEFENIQLIISPVFSLNNIFYINDYLNYVDNLSKVHKRNFISNIHLYRPDFLRVEILPDAYKNQLIEILESSLRIDIVDNPKSAVVNNFIRTTIEHLSNNPQSKDDDRLFRKFLKFTAYYDKKTNQDSFLLNSKLFSLLDPEFENIYRTSYNSIDTNKRYKDLVT